MRFRFGRYVLDSEARELLLDGAPVHLSPKAYQLLEALLERRPRAVSKADLHDRLWPKTFVVETNLANLVGEVRGVIGDTPRRPRFLRTVHGYGYAFREGDSDEASTATSTAADRRPRPASLMHRVTWERRVIPLEPGENLIGRDEDVAVRIEAPGVSRRHARIVITGDEATLEDLGSKNGTYLGERRLQERAILSDGDTFRVGRQLLIYSRQPLKRTTQKEASG
jgi:DNA-binding winged helix-turn-helix (wHTH) protein